MTKLEENISGILIFAFEIRLILIPHTLLWGVLRHLLTLPSSPVGKRPDLHAEAQQFKPHSGHKFFYILSGRYSRPYFGRFFYLVCRCHSVVCPPFTMSPKTLFSSEYCPSGHYLLENFVPLGHYSLVNNVLPQ